MENRISGFQKSRFKLLRILFTYMLIVLLTFTSFSRSAESQAVNPTQVILPGDDFINHTILKPFKIKYVLKNPWYMFWDRINGYMDVELKLSEERGIPACSIIYTLETEDYVVPDIIKLHRETLEIMERKFSNPWQGYQYNITVDATQLTGELTPLENEKDLKPPLSISGTFKHPAFEVTILDYIIATLPLRENYVVKLPFIELAKESTLEWAKASVVGKELLESTNGKTYESWIVVVDFLTGRTKGSQRKYWISNEVPYKIKAEANTEWELMEVN